MAAGDPGGLTVFATPRAHELFAEHVAGSETWVETQGLGRTVREWTLQPAKPACDEPRRIDNHWFDCLVGCAVAASMCGIRTPGEDAPRRQRKRYTQQDLRR